jgi:small subunit ribosomal protein S8
MTTHDPISDFLTRIRNARLAQHRFVDLNLTKMVHSIVKILKEQGFIESYLVNDETRQMRIFLKYSEKREAVIQGLKRISSPGLRRYVGYKKIPKVLGGMGIVVLSTPAGVVDGETARKLQVGGEFLCTVW